MDVAGWLHDGWVDIWTIDVNNSWQSLATTRAFVRQGLKVPTRNGP